jgi:acetyltransferase-like isoleucine patch superfamily enzyme
MSARDPKAIAGAVKRRLVGTRERARAGRLVRRAESALAPPPPWAYAAFGERSIVVPPARIEGADRIRLGQGVLIHEHAWFIVRPGDDAPAGPALTIGDRCVFNRFVKLVCVGEVRIGDGVIVGDHAYITDTEYELGQADAHPEARTLAAPRPVVIEDGAALGVGVIVKPGVTIGAGAYVGAGSIVTRDVPPKALAVGNPARIVRQYDPERDTW